jgi:phosphohistidine phosphatase SixA
VCSRLISAVSTPVVINVGHNPAIRKLIRNLNVDGIDKSFFPLCISIEKFDFYS